MRGALRKCSGGPPRRSFFVARGGSRIKHSFLLLVGFPATMSVEFANRLAFELNAVSGMHDTVADGVRNGGVSDSYMPLGGPEAGS